MAIRRSEHLASITNSREEPGPRDAPRSTVSEGLILVKFWMGPFHCCWSRDMITHFDILRFRHSFSSSIRNRPTHAESVDLGYQR